MSINERQHLVYANRPYDSSGSDGEGGRERRRYRTRQFIREHDRPMTTQEFLHKYEADRREDAAYVLEQQANEYRHVLGSKLRADVKEIDAKLHERRIKRLRETYNEDKKLDWMFDAPDV